METKILSAPERERLLHAAGKASSKAYAPYSNYQVGSALITVKGNLYTGCNVENASYGLTICAERSAICSAISEEGGELMRIKAIAVVNDRGDPFSPCGSCRQVIAEFDTNTIVLFRNKIGFVEMPIEELLPEGFTLKTI